MGCIAGDLHGDDHASISQKETLSIAGPTRIYPDLSWSAPRAGGAAPFWRRQIVLRCSVDLNKRLCWIYLFQHHRR
jgi:hypothetical protein